MDGMLFRYVADSFSEIEGRSGRLEMTAILSELFKKSSTAEIDKLIYITQGVVAPPFEDIELGMGEQFAIRAVAQVSGISKETIEKHYKKSGDLGDTVEEMMQNRKQRSLSSEEMGVGYVHSVLLKIARASGTGSQELKVKYLTDLLNNSSPVEARFIIRFVLGRLRLGVGDPTILDALSYVRTGDKSLREELERAYNVCSDLGYVARVFFESPEKIIQFKVQPFKPLQPALAERLSTPAEIIEKLGSCACEHKLDGIRIQIHKDGDAVELYSRKLEKMTHMFPEIVAAVKTLNVKSAIFEGEALAYNEGTGKYYSFQETIQRKRKHGITEAQKDFPLRVFVFDIIYLEGADLTKKPYEERRAAIEKVFPHGILMVEKMTLVKSAHELEACFSDCIKKGLEGIMAKDLAAPYTAGKRKFAWIKLKKSYGKSVDTVDAVIVGYYLGKGARAEFEFGGVLVAVNNADAGKLQTVARIGSGYTEEEMRSLQVSLEKIKTRVPPAKLEYKVEPDFWVEPKYVVEVAFDEITLSPMHTAGMKGDTGFSSGQKNDDKLYGSERGKGYALRFPRLLKMRTDKNIRDVTTTEEVIEMYHLQRR